MQVHPDIAALRSDLAPQRHARGQIVGACNAWAEDPAVAAMIAELKAYGGGAPFEACRVLERAFTGRGEAERMLALLASHVCPAMAANSIGHPPFRDGFDGTTSTVLLAQFGRAQLLLQAREPGVTDSPMHVFTDASRFDAVLAGEAEARIVRIAQRRERDVDFSHEPVSLRAGQRFSFDLASEALAIHSVRRRLVMLRLLRAAEEPQPGREYCTESGALLHQSAGSIASSRQEATIALMGRMGRTDAAEHIARVATGEGDISLRWQALREGLSLDTAKGFCALAEVARRSDDPLAAQAGALRAQLLETYPQLHQLEAQQCPV